MHGPKEELSTQMKRGASLRLKNLGVRDLSRGGNPIPETRKGKRGA